MHKEIKGTDMQWLAEGWWGHYFKHKSLAKAKPASVLAIATILIGAALFFTGFIAGPKCFPNFAEAPDWVLAVLVVGGVFMIIAFWLLIRASDIERAEEDKFVDYVIDQWEGGNRDIPDIEMVAEYLKNRDLLN